MRRWALLAALLAALCGPAAGGGRRRAASLGEMLREVEALMEDTQHKLRNAVQEVRGARGSLVPQLPGRAASPERPRGSGCGQRGFPGPVPAGPRGSPGAIPGWDGIMGWDGMERDQ